MKKLTVVILGIFMLFTYSLQAQVSVNINIGSPPLWGPVGYTDARYYYLPDVEAYYDIQTSMFIYYGGGKWIHRSYLPSIYSNYDLYDGYKVVMTDYKGSSPYLHFHDHKKKYAKGYRGKPQKTRGVKPQQGNHKSNDSSNSKQTKSSSSNHKQGSQKQGSAGSKNGSNGNKKNNGGGKK